MNGKTLLMNFEWRNSGMPHVTLVDPTTKEDIVKALVADGFLILKKIEREPFWKNLV